MPARHGRAGDARLPAARSTGASACATTERLVRTATRRIALALATLTAWASLSLTVAPSVDAQPRGTPIARPLGLRVPAPGRQSTYTTKRPPVSLITLRQRGPGGAGAGAGLGGEVGSDSPLGRSQEAHGSIAASQEAPVAVAPIDRTARSVYLRIMLRGSLQVSRTRVLGRRFMAPSSVSDRHIPDIAERNFREAAALVLDHAHELPLTQATATELNRILTRDLVPDDVRGQATYRRDPSAFYRWLGSAEARDLGARDPVALAERVHHEIATLDAFPDGNGRTSRLMADLVLVRSGHAPALYTDMQDYFERGGPREPATRESQVPYFREIVQRGQQFANRSLRRRAAVTPPPARPPGLRRATTTTPDAPVIPAVH